MEKYKQAMLFNSESSLSLKELLEFPYEPLMEYMLTSMFEQNISTQFKMAIVAMWQERITKVINKKSTND